MQCCLILYWRQNQNRSNLNILFYLKKRHLLHSFITSNKSLLCLIFSGKWHQDIFHLFGCIYIPWFKWPNFFFCRRSDITLECVQNIGFQYSQISFWPHSVCVLLQITQFSLPFQPKLFQVTGQTGGWLRLCVNADMSGL